MKNNNHQNYPKAQQLQPTLKLIVISLSTFIIVGSVYLLIQAPEQSTKHPLFKVLVVTLGINLLAFVWFKINQAHPSVKDKSNLIKASTSDSNKLTCFPDKDPKPHSGQ